MSSFVLLYSAEPHVPAISRIPRPFGTLGGIIERLVRGIERIASIEDLQDGPTADRSHQS
jgi:hypothetical protein